MDNLQKAAKDIPQEWILNYIDKLLNIAASFGDESPMQQSALNRAQYAMDLITAFRDYDKQL